MVRTEPDYRECDTSPSDGQPVWQLLPPDRRLRLAWLLRLLRLLRQLRLGAGGRPARPIGAAPLACPAPAAFSPTAFSAPASRTSRAGCGMCHRTAGTAESGRFLPILRRTTRRLLTAFLLVIGSVTGQGSQPGRFGGSRSCPAARSKCTFPPYPIGGNASEALQPVSPRYLPVGPPASRVVMVKRSASLRLGRLCHGRPSHTDRGHRNGGTAAARGDDSRARPLHRCHVGRPERFCAARGARPARSLRLRLRSGVIPQRHPREWPAGSQATAQRRGCSDLRIGPLPGWRDCRRRGLRRGAAEVGYA